MSEKTRKRVAAAVAVMAIYGVLSYSGQVPTLPELVTPADTGPGLVSVAEPQAEFPDHGTTPELPVESEVVTTPYVTDVEPPPVMMPPPGM